MVAVAVGATVWYLFGLRPLARWGGSWQQKSRIGLAVVALAVFVGLGRVYTGASYPSDVLAGWTLGGVWASVCLTAAEVFRRLRAEGQPLPEAGVRYARFSLVGASNALVDLGAINLLLFVHPTREPWLLVLYNLLALAVTNANNYLWNTLWTFRHHVRHDARQMGLFTLQGVLNAAIASAVLSGSSPTFCLLSTRHSPRKWPAISRSSPPCSSPPARASSSCTIWSSTRRTTDLG
jgi:membrane-associated phospholipid phosphatase